MDSKEKGDDKEHPEVGFTLLFSSFQLLFIFVSYKLWVQIEIELEMLPSFLELHTYAVVLFIT
jgi:hypothetical protein